MKVVLKNSFYIPAFLVGIGLKENLADALTALMGQALVAYTTYWPGVLTEAASPLSLEGALQIIAPLSEALFPEAAKPLESRSLQLKLLEATASYESD